MFEILSGQLTNPVDLLEITKRYKPKKEIISRPEQTLPLKRK